MVLIPLLHFFWQNLSEEHIRTKHNMADSEYTYTLVYYPYAVACARLPMGLPAGAVGILFCFWEKQT